MTDCSVEGHCFCRAVRFAYTAEPNWVLHCHGESCRRATSSPVTTWISVPKGSFRFTQGSPRTYQSSEGVTRGFCATCGSQLTYENARIPDEIHLYAASLSHPSQISPTRHVFVEEQLLWFDIGDSVPRFAKTSRGGAEPVCVGPRKNTTF